MATRAKSRPASGRQADVWRIPAITPIGSDAPVAKSLPKIVKRIAHELRPDKIVLFGSYAYGKPTPDSDVDLLVIMNAPGSLKDRVWSVSRLMMPRPFPVDILVRTPQEVAQSSVKGDVFLLEILARGKVLYERPK